VSTPAVYVCASSDELARASWAMKKVRELGWAVASDWVACIAHNGGAANPTDVPRKDRQGWSLAAVAAIASADALWMLAPEVGHGRGAFVELGLAIATGKPIMVSGPTHACSIFTALATAEVDSDEAALARLRGWLAP
jgi:hypothetical protein